MLTIGLLNNMPDAGLRQAERQVCSLLSAASGDSAVRLKLFAPGDYSRSPATQDYIRDHYDPFETLEHQSLDALIVTGAEPRSAWLEDEACWPAISRAADWAELTRTPVLWSCMAAHAAAYKLGGVHRKSLPRKLSGLFLCRRENYYQGLGRGWLQPHSRFYGLDRRSLIKAGFRMLSSSAETGPDMFTLRRSAEHLFLQGHPEYEVSTLLGEFRRDVDRFLSGEHDYYPEPPVGYYGRAVLAQLMVFQCQAVKLRNSSLMEAFDKIACNVAVEYHWRSVAVQVYETWLKRVAYFQSHRRLATRPATPGGSVASAARLLGAFKTEPSAWSP